MRVMTIALIVAMTPERVIGKGSEIPWRIKGEQKLFKNLTTGNAVIFGRKTYEAIGRPLPNRVNIVVSRDSDYDVECQAVARSVREAVGVAYRHANKVYIGGGAEIYREALPMASLIYLTKIHSNFEGDVYFPEFSPDEWEEVEAVDVGGFHPYTRHIFRRVL